MRRKTKVRTPNFVLPDTPTVMLPAPAPPARDRRYGTIWRLCAVCAAKVGKAGLKHQQRSGGKVTVLCKSCVRYGYLFNPAGGIVHKEMRDFR
jgi:L,D-peptidoglycan transpeptidase YkuD (ErfK/YbiS/YcfS/YnhG family)